MMAHVLVCTTVQLIWHCLWCPHILTYFIAFISRICSEGQNLIQLEEAAKAAGKGKWAPQPEHAEHQRDIKWTLENPRQFVDSLHNKPVDGMQSTL